MTKNVYNYHSGNLKKKLKALEDDGINVHFTVTFSKGKSKTVVINRLPLSKLKTLSTHINFDLPDSFVLEVFDGKDDENSIWIGKFIVRDAIEEPIKDDTQASTPQSQFQGFGEAEIQSIVDQRLQEKKRIEDFERLKLSVDELQAELDELQERNEELEQENEQLHIELESKKQIRYYAGMLGDILEGIGISKDKIRNPIANLMGVTHEDTAQEISATTDSSGIVEEQNEKTAEEQKRDEIIHLMSDYLKSRDNQTLSNLFTIFSEVEQNPKIAFDIISFIETQKA